MTKQVTVNVMNKLNSCPKVREVQLEVSTNIHLKNRERFEYGKFDIEIYLSHPYLIFIRKERPAVLVPIAQARKIELAGTLETFVKYMS